MITYCTLVVWMRSLSTSHFYRQQQVAVESTQYLERQRADKAKAAKGVKRKALSDDITALEKRQKIVQSAMVSMNKDADTEQAKAKNDMTLVMMRTAGLPRSRAWNLPL